MPKPRSFSPPIMTRVETPEYDRGYVETFGNKCRQCGQPMEDKAAIWCQRCKEEQKP